MELLIAMGRHLSGFCHDPLPLYRQRVSDKGPKGSDFHTVCGLALPMNRFFIGLPCSKYWVPCTLNCTIKGSWRISKGYALSLQSQEWNNVDTE